MKKTHIAAGSAVILGILALVTVARGAGGGVTAAEDERFRINGTTLTKYLGTDTFVSIPDTVSTIGEEAFSGNTTMKSIEIPSSIKTISYNAFKDCTALESVIIPDSVEKVGPGAFEGCTALTYAEVGEGVSSWGSGVFTNCDSLAKISVDRDNEYLTYYNGAVYNGNMTMLYQVLPNREGENYAMPDTVENIDTYSFWNLKNTKNVKVSSAVTTIPKQSMSSMGSVENVVLPSSVTTVGERALANNANLKQAVLPSSVTTIDKKAFAGSPDVKIYTSKSSAADTFGSQNKIPVIYEPEYPTDFMDSNAGLEERPDVGSDSANTGQTTDGSTTGTSVTTTVTTTTPSDTTDNGGQTTNDRDNNSSGFESTEGYIHPLDVPEKDDVVGKTVIVAGRAVVLMDNHKGRVYGIPDGVNAEVITENQTTGQGNPSGAESPDADSSDADSSETDSSEADSSDAGDKTDGEKTSISVDYQVSSPSEDEVIAQRKFYKKKDLTKYEIDEKIKIIGRLAFAESGLKSIKIPENVTEIEYGAFMSCASLSEVAIPGTVSAIGTKAFEGTAWLEDWRSGNGTNDSDFLIVGDGILLAYKGNEAHVELPDGVKQIGAEAFKGHTEILDVEVPASVNKICAEAFRNCSSLTGLTGCKGLKTVVRGAFYGTQISENDF